MTGHVVIVFHTLASDSVEEFSVIVGRIADNAIMTGCAILTRVVAVITLIDSRVFVEVVSTHVLAEIGSEVEVVVAGGTLPGFHVKDHGAHSL